MAFDNGEQFYELLQAVGAERRRLREAESKIRVETEPMAVRAMQLGVPLEEVAELTGYTPSVLAKWESSAAARRAHQIKQELRDKARERVRQARIAAKASQSVKRPRRRKRKRR
ncbi:hypothetical protein [Streptomyces racemochromogenes]|uniref:hypothetical protein n=1 Tax=Streptomyces racemochromogenes TaxID=67353 RepID=UPI0031E929A1